MLSCFLNKKRPDEVPPDRLNTSQAINASQQFSL